MEKCHQTSDAANCTQTHYEWNMERKRQVSIAANIQTESNGRTDKQIDRQVHRQIGRAIPRYFKCSLDSAICSSLVFGPHLFDFPI